MGLILAERVAITWPEAAVAITAILVLGYVGLKVL